VTPQIFLITGSRGVPADEPLIVARSILMCQCRVIEMVRAG
jgi:hypothetical protein